MATAYATLYSIVNSSDPTVGVLRQQIEMAIRFKAQAIIALGSATATATQKAWAQSALRDSLQYRDPLFGYLLAANPNITLAAIQAGISDATVQSQINSAIDAIYT